MKTTEACGSCHVFSPIPAAQGKIGPSLDNLTASADEATRHETMSCSTPLMGGGLASRRLGD